MFQSELIVDNKYSGLNPVQFGMEDCKKSQSFGPAVRTYWLFHYIRKGCGTFNIDGQTLHVHQGEIFVIPPFIQTYYEADKNTPWEYTWIGFTSGELFLNKLPHIIRVTNAGKIFEEMLKCSEMTNGKSAFLSAKLWELFSFILEESTQKEPGYIELALNKMNSEYMNDIHIEDIAANLHIDRSYLCAIFHKAIGVSPKEYLSNLRLSKATELMTIYGQTPSTAAISTGYSNISVFSKMFKKKYGVSPREYIYSNKSALNQTDNN